MVTVIDLVGLVSILILFLLSLLLCACSLLHFLLINEPLHGCREYHAMQLFNFYFDLKRRQGVYLLREILL